MIVVVAGLGMDIEEVGILPDVEMEGTRTGILC
jgi:hypothetical protein